MLGKVLRAVPGAYRCAARAAAARMACWASQPYSAAIAVPSPDIHSFFLLIRIICYIFLLLLLTIIIDSY